MKLQHLLLFIGLLAFDRLTTLAADPLASWTARHSPTNLDLTAVAYGNGRFVAIGNYHGIALTSPDGVTWTQRSMPIKNRYFYGAAYGNGAFVTVGDVGKIMSSPDGITWTAQVSGSSANLAAVSFLNNQFVAVGNSGAVLTSPNGSNWTSHATAATNQWRGATYANSQYLLVGFNSPLSRALVGTSSDLLQVNTFSPGFDQDFSCVAYGAGRYVVGGFGGNVLISPNGTTNFVNWTVLSNMTCTTSPMNCSLSGQSALCRFYRVVKL